MTDLSLRFMNKKYLKKFAYWFQVIALIYIALGVLLFFLQDIIIFHPKKLPADYKYSFDIPFREINIPVNEKKNLNIVQFTVPDTSRKGIVLYFHGNRGNINRYAKFASLFTRNGYEAWMIDYPGYGKTTGKRTEKNLYADALILYKMAISQVPVEQIVIYGKSLGTGIAAQLASVRDCQRLILETPYYSMGKLASRFFFIYPASAFIKYYMPTYKYVEDIRAPITILHGTNDGLIPYRQAKKLSAIKPGIELITIEKGRHNNLAEFPVFRAKLDSLLNL